MKEASLSNNADNKLPTSWQLLPFAEVTRTISDRGNHIAQSEYVESGLIPIVDQGERLIGGYTNDTNRTCECSLPVIIFGDHTRRFKYIDFRFAVGAQGVKLLQPNALCEPRYLYYFLPTLPIPDRGYSRHFQFLRQMSVPLPPLLEQRRIVAEIETQFSRLDAGISALKRVQANLKRYRAAVLQAACDGRLVPTEAELAQREGREYEPADRLLERTLAERRARWEAEQHAKMGAESNLPGYKGWKARYRDPSDSTPVDTGPLPVGWRWATIDALSTKVADGVHKKPDYVDNGIPFVTVKNLTIGPGISFENLNHVTIDDHREFTKRTNPERGDILISKDGTLGVVRIIRNDVVFSIFVSVALVKPVIRDMSEYLGLAMSSPQVQRQMVPKGSGLQHIHLEDLRMDCIPVPPLQEQRRIVAEAERRLSVIEQMETTVLANLKRAERLRQSILKRAFEGKLVPQDPSDEPASVLLERFRAEREGGRADKSVATGPRSRPAPTRRDPGEEQMRLI